MSKPKRCFVAKAYAGQGWRIWDNTLGRFWGDTSPQHPEELLQELNTEKRPEQLQILQTRMAHQR